MAFQAWIDGAMGGLIREISWEKVGMQVRNNIAQDIVVQFVCLEGLL